MIDIFKSYEKEKTKSHGIGGRKSLIPEDKVLLMLSYYREYRTLEHIGFDYGVSEATASRVEIAVEKVLI
ncbi:MAG: transposase family protein [Campylobacterales bacterium]|nr:transposase family protein [Campylobacterales bacterium]